MLDIDPPLIAQIVVLLLLGAASVVLARMAARRSRRMPRVAGVVLVIAGLANLLSALRPHDGARMHLVTAGLGAGIPDTAHALAVPAGVALLLTGRFLAQRHRRALDAAVGWLVVLAVLDVVKGLDLWTAATSAGLAWILWRARDAFRVEPLPVRSAALGLALVRLGLAALALAVGVLVLVTWRLDPRPSFGVVLTEAIALLTLARDTVLPMPHHLGWVPAALGTTGVVTLLTAAMLIFRRRPLSVPRMARTRTTALLRRYGTDTLSGFVLREDVHHHVTADGRAAVAFCVRSGVLLISGVPAGPPDAVDELVRELRDVADHHGLRLGVFGATEELAVQLTRTVGLRPHYIGCEAVVDPSTFTLTGRPMKKVRQAVQRVERNGYTAETLRVGDADPVTAAGIRRVVGIWGNNRDFGFTMAMDIDDPSAAASFVTVARDAAGTIRAVVHVVPAPGGPAWSLSTTPHERNLPNGVVDFLIVRMVEAAAEHGVERVSLNFATMRQWLKDPQTPYQRVMGAIIHAFEPITQFESLYRFNQKFRPDWVARYALYDRRLDVPRALLVLLLAENQIRLPKPDLLRRIAPRVIEAAPALLEDEVRQPRPESP